MLQRSLILSWLLLWTAQPFLAMVPPTADGKQAVCSSCGMKDLCGPVCCCLGGEEAQGQPACSQENPGLFASGCNPAPAGSFTLLLQDPFLPAVLPSSPFLTVAAGLPAPGLPAAPQGASFVPTPPPETFL